MIWDSANEVKQRMSRLDAIASVSAAITALEEIKGLHRLGAWDLALNRYTGLRKHLVAIEPGLTEEQRMQVGRALSQFRIMEKKVERAIAAGEHKEIDVGRFNDVISGQIDSLTRAMIAVKAGA